MTIVFKSILIPTVALSIAAFSAACNAQDSGIRRSGVHLSHGYPIPYNSYNYPRPYVGVPPYQIGVNSTGYPSHYGSGYSYGGYGYGQGLHQQRNYYRGTPGLYRYNQSGRWRY